MISAQPQVSRSLVGAYEHVSSDFMQLASHMNECRRSQGRFAQARVLLESLHAVARPRIVTTLSIVVVGVLGLLAFV